jgi:phage terminase large subunit-like protein
MANLRELLIGFGKAKQADIATANSGAQIWRLAKLNRDVANPRHITENDAEELGKGHEFATALYKSHIESGPHSLEKYLSSQFAAWLFAFGLGKVVKSGTGPYTYTCTPINPVTDGMELPYFSYVEQIRPGGSAVRDIMLVGCAIAGFRIEISSGPGRTNAKATVKFAHSGKITEPSGITVPTATAENLLNAYSLSCTVNGVDYVATKNFVTLTMGWDNAFRDTSDYYPGSGQQDGYQIKGRMEVGDRVPSFSMVARFKNGSTELQQVRDLTTGTAVIGLAADANNSTQVTWQKLGFSVAELGETDGIVTVQITGLPMYDETNGVVSAVVTTPEDGIG